MKIRSVYVIGESENGPVKIGVAENPQKRLSELQTGNPRRLFIFNQCETACSFAVETWIFARLHSKRLRLEWFSVSASEASEAIADAIALESTGDLLLLGGLRSIRIVEGVVQKKCGGICGQWKELSEFFTSNSKTSRRQSRCKDCTRADLRNWRAADPERRLRHNAGERRRKVRIRRPWTVGHEHIHCAEQSC